MSVRGQLCFFPTLWIKRQKEEEEEEGGGGINRLNDKKEQCCDSEQLVFPSVDSLCLSCVSVCARVRARLMETDCPVIVHF